MTQFYTYLHCKPNGDPFYVGKGGGGKRCKRSHKLTQRNKHHANIVEKYGANNIQIFIFNCESEQQAFADEIHTIAQLRSEGFVLANLTDGGEGASNPSPEARAKISAANIGNKNTLGHVHSPEAKIKIANAARKLWSDPAHAAHISEKMKHRVFTDEHKRRISAAKTGKCLGRVPSVESRSKQSAALKGAPWSDARRAAHMKASK